MFELSLNTQLSAFLLFLKESESGCQNSTTGSSLCSIFISRESGTSELYYCAYFEALLCKHMEQTDEVHFTVRL